LSPSPSAWSPVHGGSFISSTGTAVTDDKKNTMSLQVAVHHHRHGHDLSIWWIPEGCEPLSETEIIEQLEDFEDDREDEWIDFRIIEPNEMLTEEEARAQLESIRKVVKIR
jgi:hypothetical protein